MGIAANSKKIGQLRPMEGQGSINYIEDIKKRMDDRIPKNYYVEYSIENAKDAKVNWYAREIQQEEQLLTLQQLTIEYDENLPEGAVEKPKKIRIVVAEAEHFDTAGIKEFSKARAEINEFLKRATSEKGEPPRPEEYISRLEELGWSMTTDGIDAMLVTKEDGVVEIHKTAFTEAELESLSEENLQHNMEQHNARREPKMIKMLEEYIVDVYDNMPSNFEELKQEKRKVQQYIENKSAGVETNDLLDTAFRTMKPIQETEMNPVMEKMLLKTLKEYLDKMPGDFLENKWFYLKEYLSIREDATTEKQNNNGKLPENSASVRRVEGLIDEFTDKKREEKRDLVNQRLDMLRQRRKLHEEKEAREM